MPPRKFGRDGHWWLIRGVEPISVAGWSQLCEGNEIDSLGPNSENGNPEPETLEP